MLEHIFWVSNIYSYRIKLIIPQIQSSVDLWMEQYLQMRKYESIDKFLLLHSANSVFLSYLHVHMICKLLKTPIKEVIWNLGNWRFFKSRMLKMSWNNLDGIRITSLSVFYICSTSCLGIMEKVIFSSYSKYLLLLQSICGILFVEGLTLHICM